MTWRRWLKYGKARIDAAVRDVSKDLDRKEAELAADQAGKPWLADTRDTPTFDDTRARIEDRAARAPTAPSGATDADASNLAVEMAERDAAAKQRLAEIRKSLDLPDHDDH